jgi:DNA-binding NarL/FixJ family response regulator
MTTSSPISVVVADDHPMFRAGLRMLVEDCPALDLVGEAADGEEVVQVCLASRPQVVLMDIHMPNASGVDATRRILAELPHVGVLMLTMLEDDTSVFAAMRAGARGYVLKGAAPDDIVRAITAAAAGEAIFSPALAARMAHFFTAGRGGDPHPFPDLSVRERDVLDLMAAGRSNAQIAGGLGLSEKTVRNNVSAIFAKLRVADRATAIVQARDAGLGRSGHR